MRRLRPQNKRGSACISILSRFYWVQRRISCSQSWRWRQATGESSQKPGEQMCGHVTCVVMWCVWSCDMCGHVRCVVMWRVWSCEMCGHVIVLVCLVNLTILSIYPLLCVCTEIKKKNSCGGSFFLIGGFFHMGEIFILMFFLTEFNIYILSMISFVWSCVLFVTSDGKWIFDDCYF